MLITPLLNWWGNTDVSWKLSELSVSTVVWSPTQKKRAIFHSSLFCSLTFPIVCWCLHCIQLVAKFACCCITMHLVPSYYYQVDLQPAEVKSDCDRQLTAFLAAAITYPHASQGLSYMVQCFDLNAPHWWSITRFLYTHACTKRRYLRYMTELKLTYTSACNS